MWELCIIQCIKVKQRADADDWLLVVLLAFLLSCGLMKVRSSKLRRILLGPLTSWIC